VGLTLIEVGTAKDMADLAYEDQRTTLRSLDTELRVMQTLHVSGRDHAPK
jgi:hypothetical protein